MREIKEIVSTSLFEYAFQVCKVIYKQYLVAIKKDGLFSLALSGGNTPKIVFDVLVENYSFKIDWARVHFFWTDERCVPLSHEHSNYKLAFEHLLKYINPCSVNIIDGIGDPPISAKKYERVLVEHFQLVEGELPEIDFILLGMGEDGHVASIFPNTACEQKDAMVVATPYAINGYHRISLSLEVINASVNTTLLVSNRYKKHVLANMDGLPVHNIKPNTLMFCDV